MAYDPDAVIDPGSAADFDALDAYEANRLERFQAMNGYAHRPGTRRPVLDGFSTEPPARYALEVELEEGAA